MQKRRVFRDYDNRPNRHMCERNDGHYAIRTADLRAQENSLFRWQMRKKGYGFLSYHCLIPVRYCLTYVCSGPRELAMPAQKPQSHGAISPRPPFCIVTPTKYLSGAYRRITYCQSISLSVCQSLRYGIYVSSDSLPVRPLTKLALFSEYVHMLNN